MPHQSGGMGLANFEVVRKSVEENIYERSKGCSKHWTVLRFMLELLILKAKHGWSDGSFNDLLRILVWLLPKPNKCQPTHVEQKKTCQPIHDGCGKNLCMSKSFYFVWCGYFQRFKQIYKSV